MKYIDTDNRANTHILVNVENVTADGFDITFETWADSIVWGLGANWIAFILGLPNAKGNTQ